MGGYGGFYSGDKKKKKKADLEKAAAKIVHVYTAPKVEITGKGKKKG